MKYIVCYSGGHSSAICAIECVRKFGKENVILLNHDITGSIEGTQIEHEDIKRFKQEVADYLGLQITYCNSSKYTTPSEVIKDLGIIHNVALHTALCTYFLKTEPFYKWLNENYPATHDNPREDIRIVYGFDKEERVRVQNRVSKLDKDGYRGEFPMLWETRTIYDTQEIGINKPVTYDIFKHANCIACLKAGRQHWFVVYCLYPKIFQHYKELEEEVGYTIIKGSSLKELEKMFYDMKNKHNIQPTEKIKGPTFWAKVKKIFKEYKQEESEIPCDCGV